jgi:hypothetical protein
MLYKPIKGPAATVACAWCSKGFRPRRGRPAKFCSDRCRQGHFRYARNVGTTDPTAHNETPPKNLNVFKALQARFWRPRVRR